jgi:hypothetical protein
MQLRRAPIAYRAPTARAITTASSRRPAVMYVIHVCHLTLPGRAGTARISCNSRLIGNPVRRSKPASPCTNNPTARAITPGVASAPFRRDRLNGLHSLRLHAILRHRKLLTMSCDLCVRRKCGPPLGGTRRVGDLPPGRISCTQQPRIITTGRPGLNLL